MKARLVDNKLRPESSVELARRYRRELQDLVDLGEISRSTAQEVFDDMLEPERPGRARRVRLEVWLDHCSEFERHGGRPAWWDRLRQRAEQFVKRLASLLR